MGYTTPYRYNKVSTFNPRAVERQIVKNHSRALAIFDILEKVIHRGTAPVKEVRQAIQEGHPDKASFALHKLKNSLGNFGGMRVWDVASDIEELLKTSPQDPAIDSLLYSLERELVLFFEKAAQWLQQQKQLKKEPSKTSLQDEQLMNLLKQLSEFNLSALESYEVLADYLKNHIAPEIIIEIEMTLSDLAFDKTVTLIEDNLIPLSSVETDPCR